MPETSLENLAENIGEDVETDAGSAVAAGEVSPAQSREGEPSEKEPREDGGDEPRVEEPRGGEDGGAKHPDAQSSDDSGETDADKAGAETRDGEDGGAKARNTKSRKTKTRDSKPRDCEAREARTRDSKPRDSKPRDSKPRADKVLLAAVDEIRDIIAEVVPLEEVGDSVGSRVDGERLLTHFFACLKPGYVGWHWAITVARAPRQKHTTVCEIDLLPGPGALLAPEWVPWEERLEPSDVNPADVLPYRANDERLVPIREVSENGDSGPLSRVRVLSDQGVNDALARWSKRGKGRVQARKVPSTCASCGFLVKIDGPLGDKFGVCTNEWSTNDASVVSLADSCGAHSETDVERQGSDWPVTPPRINEFDLEILTQ